MFIRRDSPVLITGINGFIGSHLAERLLAEGVPVRGTTRRPETAAWLLARGAQVLAADLLDAASWPRAVAGCQVVVHAAAWTGGPGLSDSLAWRTNVEGTGNVLAASTAAGVERFLYISSVAVYGLNRSPLIDESAATPAVGQLYPDSKIAAEASVRSSLLPYTIIRPASTYGPRGDAWTLGPIEQMRQGRLLLLGEDRGLVTPGYIDNVVDGLWLALTRPAALGETFNLCDDRPVTYREFYLAYAHMLGRSSLPSVPEWSARLARVPVLNAVRRFAGKPAVGPWSLHFRRNPSQFGIARAQALLGYRPTIDFQEGMRRTEVWLRSNGYLS
jgi:nucleoside-diphosphate-sugar epimerase